MSITITSEDLHATRWREWQLQNEYDQRKGAARARVVFTTLFAIVGLWLGVQFLL